MSDQNEIVKAARAYVTAERAFHKSTRQPLRKALAESVGRQEDLDTAWDALCAAVDAPESPGPAPTPAPGADQLSEALARPIPEAAKIKLEEAQRCFSMGKGLSRDEALKVWDCLVMAKSFLGEPTPSGTTPEAPQAQAAPATDPMEAWESGMGFFPEQKSQPTTAAEGAITCDHGNPIDGECRGCDTCSLPENRTTIYPAKSSNLLPPRTQATDLEAIEAALEAAQFKLGQWEELFGPVLEFAQRNSKALGIGLGQSISKYVLEMLTERAQSPAPAGGRECLWTEGDDGSWETACGHKFVWETDGPKENGAEFCLYCGKTLAEKKHEASED